MADLNHLGRDEGRRRVAELLERFDLVDAAAKPALHLLGRHAPPARPRDDARGRAADHLPRRADDGPRSAQPAGDVGHRPRPRRATASRSSSRRSTSRRPTGSRSRIALLDGGRIVARARPRSSSGSCPGGSVRLEFGDAAQLDRAARALGDGSRDDAGLALEVPSDGGVHALRALLDRLDDASIEVDGLSVRSARPRRRLPLPHRPPRRREGADAMTATLLTDSTTMLRRSLRRMRRYPSLTLFIAGHPGRAPAAVRVRVRRDAGRRPRRAERGVGRARGLHRVRHARDPAADRRRRGAGDGDLGGDGHDRGDHRPLPDDGDRARVGPRRARARQRHPDAARGRSRGRRGGGDRVPAARPARARGSPHSGCSC